jgi:DNA transformation protein and related proteins
MGRDNQFTAFVAGQLEPLGPVHTRPMFGGHGVYIDGLFCAIIHRDVLYLKADELSRAEFEAIGARPFRPFEGKPATLRYYEVGADLLEDRTKLLEWASKALAAARRAPPPRPRRR